MNLVICSDARYKEVLANIKERHIFIAKDLVTKNQKQVISHIKNSFKELENILKEVVSLGQILSEKSDLILSFGERLSAYIISQSLASN